MKRYILFILLVTCSNLACSQSRALVASMKADEVTNTYIDIDLLPSLIKLRRKAERKLSKKDKRFIDSLRTMYYDRLEGAKEHYIGLNNGIKLSKRDSIRMSTYAIFPSTLLYLKYNKYKLLPGEKKKIYDGVTEVRKQKIYPRKKWKQQLDEIFIRDRYIRRVFCSRPDLAVLKEPYKVIPGKGPHLSKTYFGGYFGFILMDYKKVKKYLRARK